MASDDTVAQIISTLQEALSASQERENQLRSELDLVKQDNLKLAEANLKLQAQVDALTMTKPEPLAVAKPTPPPARPFRPIASNAHLSKVNNQNIGWFD
jgi:hypothetical protein